MLFRSAWIASLGRTVVVENRSGAGGITGVRAVIAAEADGSTLLISPTAPVVIIPAYNPSAGYQTETDLTPISHLVSQDLALAVGPGLSAKNMAELLAEVRANPAKATYGTPGAGSSLHLMGVKLATQTGIKFTPVHYRGTSLALNDVVAGQLPMLFSALPDQVEQHRAGNIRIIATSGRTRSTFVPEVPTFTEAGVDIASVSWFAAYAPAGLAAKTAEQLSAVMAQTVRRPENAKRLSDLGFIPVGSSPAELATLLKAEKSYWLPVIREAGIKTP